MAYKLQRPAYYRSMFNGGDQLYSYAWRTYVRWLAGSIDSPDSDDEVVGWLYQIASERVNSSRSSFYIKGG